MDDQVLRDEIAEQLEIQLAPLLDKDKYEGGYNCCGCSTYDWILDHAIAIARGVEYVHPNG